VENRLDQTLNAAYRFPFRGLEISEAAVSEVNNTLDWHAATVLNGKLLLGRLGANKRMKPGPVPDRRITELHRLIDLTGKSILEVGCFEGIHTLGLRLYSDDVTAIDIRPSNVIKTLTRLSLHGTYAKVFIADVERLSREFGQFDVIFHCGVLYHLESPVEHIFSLTQMCQYLFLDTHVTSKRDVEKTLGHFTYRGTHYEEAGWNDPFSGKGSRSFWLTEEDLQEALRRAGFSSITLIERRAERNGPRLTILASK
jgi:tRNA (mo5U34)-methyltransferase